MLTKISRASCGLLPFQEEAWVRLRLDAVEDSITSPVSGDAQPMQQALTMPCCQQVLDAPDLRLVDRGRCPLCAKEGVDLNKAIPASLVRAKARLFVATFPEGNTQGRPTDVAREFLDSVECLENAGPARAAYDSVMPAAPAQPATPPVARAATPAAAHNFSSNFLATMFPPAFSGGEAPTRVPSPPPAPEIRWNDVVAASAHVPQTTQPYVVAKRAGTTSGVGAKKLADERCNRKLLVSLVACEHFKAAAVLVRHCKDLYADTTCSGDTAQGWAETLCRARELAAQSDRDGASDLVRCLDWMLKAERSPFKVDWLRATAPSHWAEPAGSR